MILFAISVILVLISSYFTASILDTKKTILGLIYTFLIAFSQVVITFEILSLFNLIYKIPILCINILFLIVSIVLWNKKNKPLWSIDCIGFIKRVLNSFKLDKSLFLLFLGFLVFISTAIFLCLIMPLTSGDATSYHAARSLMWALQHNLNHFEVADIRNICLPINSEILYTWILVFTQKNALFSFPSLIGYIFSMIALFKILDMGGFCTRKKLWLIFILTSFPAVLVQASGTETDIIIAAFILSSLFMFWYALKTNEKTPVYMASLAYALAIGTKTTSLLMIPGVAIFMLFLCFKYKNYKFFARFIGFGAINFLLFSSYNYILNFLDFKNFFGPENFMVVSKNYYGTQGAVANFVKYIFMFFDFTGFKWSDYIGGNLLDLRTAILAFLHVEYVKNGLYTSEYSFQRTLLEPMMGGGILGFLLYLPCLIWGIIKPLFNLKSRKNQYIFCFAIIFIINLIAISYQLSYMAYSVRFIMSFMVISSPVLLYSYFSKRNPLKYIIILFSLFYLIFVSTNLWARPIKKIVGLFQNGKTISYVRYAAACTDFEEKPQFSQGACILAKKIELNYTTDNRILAFVGTGDNIFILKSLEYKGYKIDLRRLESISENDFAKYNLIITTSEGQLATNVSDFKRRKNDYILLGKKLITNTKRDIPCMYKYNPNIPISKSDAPFQSACIIPKEFAKNHNLSAIDSTGLVKPLMHENAYYIIIQNNKKPINFKPEVISKQKTNAAKLRIK